jgi:hypothetical protein
MVQLFSVQREQVEASAYAILTALRHGDVDYCYDIMVWLHRQRTNSGKIYTTTQVIETNVHTYTSRCLQSKFDHTTTLVLNVTMLNQSILFRPMSLTYRNTHTKLMSEQCGFNAMWFQGNAVSGQCGFRSMWFQGNAVSGHSDFRAMWLQGNVVSG